MGGISGEELARIAGTTPDVVDRMITHGLLPADGQSSVRTDDVQRVQMVESFERAGISMETLSRTISAGHFSLAFTEVEWQNPWVGAFTGETYGEAVGRVGIPIEVLQRVYEATGLPRPGGDDPVPASDAQMMPTFATLLGLMPDAETATHVIRIYSENLRRMAQAEARFYHTYVEEPLLRSGISEPQMRDMAVEVSRMIAPLVDALVMWIYHRHQMHCVIEDLIEHLESALETAGVGRTRPTRPPAMVFLDLAGYTRLTEERGDEAAAELASSFGDLVSSRSTRFGGQPVKWLGDGVMFHFPDPGDAVRCALDLVERAPAEGLPPAHVGVQAGPVIVRDGDYFGRTVNMAARIAAHAGAGEVLVGADLVEVTNLPSVRFEPVGSAALKGMAAPVELYRALPAEQPA